MASKQSRSPASHGGGGPDAESHPQTGPVLVGVAQAARRVREGGLRKNRLGSLSTEKRDNRLFAIYVFAQGDALRQGIAPLNFARLTAAAASATFSAGG